MNISCGSFGAEQSVNMKAEHVPAKEGACMSRGFFLFIGGA
jgi:hypothetical protein